MHVTRVRRLLAASLAVGLLATACGTEDASESDGTETAEQAGGDAAEGTAEIGLIAAEQGNFAFAGTSYAAGAQLAVDEANAADAVPGVELALVKEEGSAAPDQSITAFNKLAARAEMSTVVCCISSAVAGALKPLAVDEQMPLVVYGATLPDLQEPPYVYRPALLPQGGIRQVGAELAEKLAPETAVHLKVVDNDGLADQADAAVETFESAGVETLKVVETLIADTDFSGPVTEVLAEDPDIVTVYLLGEQAATVVKSLREQGYEGIILANNAVATASNLESFGGTLADTFYAVEYFPGSGDEMAQSFTEAYEEATGETPDLFASQGYTAVQYAIEGIRRAAESGDTGSAAVAEALQGIESLDTVWGELTFEEGQGMSEDYAIVQIDAEGQPTIWEG